MTDNPMGSSQEEIIERMRSARKPEPDGPTDEAEAESNEEVEAQLEEEQEVSEEISEEAESEDSNVEEATNFDEDYSAPIDTIGYEYDQDSDTYSFKSNGKTVRANADKLIERFSQAENYTKDKMALSEERKQSQDQLVEERAALEGERSKISDLSTELEALIQVEEKIDPGLEEYDPSEFIRQTKAIDSRKTALGKAKLQLQEAQQQQYQAKVKTESDALLKALPQWSDQEVMTKDMETLNTYFADQGVTGQDIANLMDHRIYVMALDAAKYQAMQKNSAKVKKQVKKAPKSVKPGLKAASRDNQQMSEVKARFRKSGSNQDAVALLRAKRANKR